MSLLELKNVSVQLSGNKALLSNLDISLESGGLYCVLGPNGAGKSSILKTIGGEFSKNIVSGEITYQAKTLDLWSVDTLATQLAFLPQFSSLNFPFFVEEIVAMGRIPHNTGKNIDQFIVDKCIKIFDLDFLRGRIYPSLSGGEKQRVQLARVLCQIWCDDQYSGQLLMLDEPTSSLDIAHQHSLLSQLQKLSDRGLCVLAVMHDLNLAFQYANKILLIKDGHCIARGDAKYLVEDGTVSSLFNIDARIIVDEISGESQLVTSSCKER